MTIGIFAKTFEGNNLEEILDQLVAHNIHHIHLNMSCAGLSPMPDEIPDSVSENIKKACKHRSISIVGLSGTFNMIHPDKQILETGLRQLEILAETAPKIGTNFISLCTGTRHLTDKWTWHQDNETSEAWHDLRIAMQKAIAIAEKYDILLGIEPEHANVVSSPVKARKLLDEMQSDRLRIILDPANLFDKALTAEIREKVKAAIDLLGSDIYMAHAKDRTADGKYVATGKGAVDFRHFIQKLRNTGFEGPLVMHGLAADEVNESLALIRSCFSE